MRPLRESPSAPCCRSPRVTCGPRATRTVSRVAVVATAFSLLVLGQAEAQDGKPFGLPFSEPPGPGTWYVAQPYGNTIYAYYERYGLYKSAQGMHMGIDLATACGTPVVAIGDGVVRSVDGRGGSPPHNLMIDHHNGYVSFYGHLRAQPRVAVGRKVRRGEVVALSGDMYGTCHDSPHLHLEIRDETLARLFNPVTLIDADWHSLLLLGSSGLPFERDLDAPRRLAVDRRVNRR